MTYKYIACDLDGTSLQTNVGKLTKKTVASVLAYQKASKGRFFIATGRNLIVTNHFAKQLGVKLPIITLNGAVIYDLANQKVLFQRTIPKQTAIEITQFCLKNDYHIIANTYDKLVGIGGGERTDFYRNELADYPEIRDHNIVVLEKEEQIISDVIEKGEEIVKFTISLEEEDIKAKDIVEAMLQKYDVAVAGTYMLGRYLIDVFNRNANKGEAIKYLAENILNVRADDIVTIGDNNNDLEFIRDSKYGICPKNAVDAAKKVAFKVLEKTVEEDAIAYFLDDIIKNKGEIY